MRIGIIVGSVRQGSRTQEVAEHLAKLAAERGGAADYDVVALAVFDLPLLTTSVHPMAANQSYDDPRVQRWSDAVSSYDGFVFVTPDYNHGVPGAFKNAVDSLGPEWVGKPVGFVGHGSVGGVRAIEQWRQILSNFSMPLVRAELNLSAFTHWPNGQFTPEERHAAETSALLDQLEAAVAAR